MNTPQRGASQTSWLISVLVLALLGFGTLPELRCAAANPVSSNPPPRRLVVLLPFANSAGDLTLDDWQQALPSLVRMCLDEATYVTVPRWKAIRPALDQAGWSTGQAVDATLARHVARVLNADVVVWGRFGPETDGWMVQAHVLRADSEAAPTEIQASARNWKGLVESLTRRLVEQWGGSFADHGWVHWNLQMTESDKAARSLAKGIALELRKAPVTEQEQAWREALAADPRCGGAYMSLVGLLGDAVRKTEGEKLVQEFMEQRPQSCSAQLSRAWLLWAQDDKVAAETAMREALRLHPGCPAAARALYDLLSGTERLAELIKLLREAHGSRPDAESTVIFLAEVLAEYGDLDAAHDLLRQLRDLPEEDESVDLALLRAASMAGAIELAGRELLRLGPQAEKSKAIRSTLESAPHFSIRGTRDGRPIAPVARPRHFTQDELDRELNRRLSADERKQVVNPLEITPELQAEARRLTVGITNQGLQSFALFAEVARRGRGSGDGGRRTASEALKDSGDAQVRRSCQEHAKLFVALARAIGSEAWLVHIERCADGSQAYHDCAALFLDGQGVLVDSTWRTFGIQHREFTVLDDVQAISHQAMQLAGQPDPQRLRMGLKLNPEDRWTRLQFVRGMAQAGEIAAATEELGKVRAAELDGWDTYQAAATLEMVRKRWSAALTALRQALVLSPSNVLVHARLAQVYMQLNEPAKSREHLEIVLRLDRGEVSRAFRQESQSNMAMLTAFAQTQSGEQSSVKALHRQAEAGDLAAQIALAKACFDVRPPRTEEGMRWLLKAAEQGDPQAQFSYARNLLALRGETVAREVVSWLNKAAEQGNDDAQYRLGLILYEGKLAPRDNVAAAQWVHLAADQGHVDARHLLKEMQVFLGAAELAQGRKRADAFKPAKNPATKPRASSGQNSAPD